MQTAVAPPFDPNLPLLSEALGLPVEWPFPWGWPTVGTMPSRPPAEMWRSILLIAALERDRITDFVARQKTDHPFLGPTVIGAYRWKSQRDAAASISTRASVIALGLAPASEERAALAYACPEHMDELLQALDAEVIAWQQDLNRAERRVRAAVRPLIEQHAPQTAVYAAAERVRDCLPKRDVVQLCLSISRNCMRRSRRHG